MSGHERERDRELELRLDQALDAMAADRSPEVVASDDPEYLDLIDAARVARNLREPAWPGDDFARDLSACLAHQLDADGGSIWTENGYRPAEPRPVVMMRRKRGRGLLVPLAALLRVLGSGVVAGMVVGLVVGGIGSRIAMYISGQLYLRENPGSAIITESSGQPVGSFSWSGTFDLLIEGMFTGMLGGLLYVAIRRWLPATPRWHGAIFGLFLLLVTGSATITAGNEDFSRIGPAWLNISMFAVIFLLFGLLVAPLADRVDRWLTSLQSSQGQRPARILSALFMLPFGVLGVLVTTALILTAIIVTGDAIVSVAAGKVSIWSILGVLTVVLVVVVLPVTSALVSPAAAPIITRLPWHGDPSADRRPAALARIAWYAFMVALALGLALMLYNVISILTAS